MCVCVCVRVCVVGAVGGGSVCVRCGCVGGGSSGRGIVKARGEKQGSATHWQHCSPQARGGVHHPVRTLTEAMISSVTSCTGSAQSTTRLVFNPEPSSGPAALLELAIISRIRAPLASAAMSFKAPFCMRRSVLCAASWLANSTKAKPRWEKLGWMEDCGDSAAGKDGMKMRAAPDASSNNSIDETAC